MGVVRREEEVGIDAGTGNGFDVVLAERADLRRGSAWDGAERLVDVHRRKDRLIFHGS